MQRVVVTILVLGGPVVWCMSYFRLSFWILVTSSPLPGFWNLGFGMRRIFKEQGLWRGGGGVDENRFGTVRQQRNVCQIMHLLNLHAYSHILECLLVCLIRFTTWKLRGTNSRKSGLKFGSQSRCPTTTTTTTTPMYLCPKLSHCFWLCPAQSGKKH